MVEKTKNSFTTTKSSSDLKVGKLKIWYTLPFEIFEQQDLSKGGWTPSTERPDIGQSTYFHKFVTDFLWPSPDSEQFKKFTKPVFQNMSVALRYQKTKYKAKLHTVEFFHLGPHDPKNLSRENPGMGVLTVGLEVQTDGQDFTLAMAQDFLEAARRIAPRWYEDDNETPGDALTEVRCAGTAPTKSECNENFARFGKRSYMPWVKRLLDPYDMDSDTIGLFGDERAYMTSGILIGTGDETNDQAFDLACSVDEADLFRLAEADRHGTGYNYNKPFLETLKEGIFYNRHAPDKETRTGRTTWYLTTHHHFCAVGTSGYMRDNIIGKNMRDNVIGTNRGDVDQYYRHMHFLCVLEYFRLIQFSRLLTSLVRDYRGNDKAFGDRLQKLRKEFLQFTHLYHFTNVSSQLQPREMYIKLRAAMGLDEMFHEIDAELVSAVSYRDAIMAQEATSRAERLNELVSVGVPLSLIVGAGGMNVLIGESAPFGLATTGGNWLLGAAQIALLTAITSFIWGSVLISDTKSETAQKRAKNWYFISAMAIVITAVIWLFFGGT